MDPLKQKWVIYTGYGGIQNYYNVLAVDSFSYRCGSMAVDNSQRSMLEGRVGRHHYLAPKTTVGRNSKIERPR
jgi:hypothetical protein